MAAEWVIKTGFHIILQAVLKRTLPFTSRRFDDNSTGNCTGTTEKIEIVDFFKEAVEMSQELFYKGK